MKTNLNYKASLNYIILGIGAKYLNGNDAESVHSLIRSFVHNCSVDDLTERQASFINSIDNALRKEIKELSKDNHG